MKHFILRHGDVLPAAQLTVEAQPAGAKILVDGIEIGSAPRAIARVGIGAHVVEVSKEGFGTLESPVVVLQRETAEMKMKLGPAGTLAITADASDVNVYVDGVLRGTAPLSIEIAEGTHTVTGMKTGSKRSHATTLVKAEQSTDVALSHPATQAFLAVVSSPVGAEVIIDGESAGVTPVAERIVEPGRHVVDVKRNDYSRRVVVDLTEDARRQLEFNMDAAGSSSAPTAIPAPSAFPPRHSSNARLQSGLGISLGGVALSLASAAVLLTQKDNNSRTAAAVTMVAGATGMVLGPAIFFRELGPRDPGKIIRADRDEKQAAVPGVRAAFRF